MFHYFKTRSNILYWQVLRGLKGSYISPLILILQQVTWPLILVVTLYFTYSPFTGKSGENIVPSFTHSLPLWTYLLTGIFVLHLFLEYINIGGRLSFERDFGVLEIVYLSPVSRIFWLVSNAFSGLVTGILSFIAFAFIAIYLFDIKIYHPWLLTVMVFYFLLMSLPWGAFVIAVFLAGRNMRLFYAIFETPAEFLSGTRFPIQSLPFFLFGIAFIYPISHSVSLIRNCFAQTVDPLLIIKNEILLLILAIVYLCLAYFMILYAEKKGKNKGDLTYS
ncbi:MAG: ABC transporter permease [Spirochaetes bacterium]|nr:ABC transporter permease [Spirochaetota bacterium]